VAALTRSACLARGGHCLCAFYAACVATASGIAAYCRLLFYRFGRGLSSPRLYFVFLRSQFGTFVFNGALPRARLLWRRRRLTTVPSIYLPYHFTFSAHYLLSSTCLFFHEYDTCATVSCLFGTFYLYLPPFSLPWFASVYAFYPTTPCCILPFVFYPLVCSHRVWINGVWSPFSVFLLPFTLGPALGNRYHDGSLLFCPFVAVLLACAFGRRCCIADASLLLLLWFRSRGV